MHIFRLKPLLPKGMKLEDLDADRELAASHGSKGRATA